jgi:ribosomal protein L35AE/L33A
MFDIPQPSMALNSHNVPPPDYRMWNTRKVDSNVRASDLISNIASVADSATGGYLRCLVINCHGNAGILSLGTGIGRGETPLFTALAGKVHTIMIVACDVAQIGQANTWKDGNLFCGEIAKNSGAYVFASTALQSPYLYSLIGLPVNQVDEYEGAVYRYDPSFSNRQVDNPYVQRWMYNLKIGRKPEQWK